jgi:hypothetical protein
MEAPNSSKTPASVYKTIQCHNLGGKQPLPHKLISEYVTYYVEIHADNHIQFL